LRPAKILSAPCAGITRIKFEGSPAVAGLSALRLPCWWKVLPSPHGGKEKTPRRGRRGVC